MKLAYNNYSSNERSITKRLHRKLTKSPVAVKLLFSINVLPSEIPNYFDLTTILLGKVLKKRLQHLPDLKVLEIGVGGFAVLSGYISRWGNQTIDAVDKDVQRVDSSIKHVELNKVNVNVFYSDLFSNIEVEDYGLIFWNLPYYVDPDTYLPDLFDSVPNYMSDKSELIIGYNSTVLSRDVILNILRDYNTLCLKQIKTYSWNLHEILVIMKN